MNIWIIFFFVISEVSTTMGSRMWPAQEDTPGSLCSNMFGGLRAWEIVISTGTWGPLFSALKSPFARIPEGVSHGRKRYTQRSVGEKHVYSRIPNTSLSVEEPWVQKMRLKTLSYGAMAPLFSVSQTGIVLLCFFVLRIWLSGILSFSIHYPYSFFFIALIIIRRFTLYLFVYLLYGCPRKYRSDDGRGFTCFVYH